MKNTLAETALVAKSSDEFTWMIQQGTPESGQGGLLADLYTWEQSTPENIKRFKMTGWFGVAAAYWREIGNGFANNSTLRDYEPEQKYGTPADFQEHTRFGGTREDY